MADLNKTIVSLVTLPLTQNIALIRISGSATYQIIEKIFSKKISRNNLEKNKIVFGEIINSKKEVIDKVLLFCFFSPHSFTGEDLIEVSCHGNLIIVNQILELILENGAEMAEKGEFTKRAFFNDKINLVQASSINEIIRSPSERGVKMALHNLSSESKKDLNYIENKILEIIAIIKVNIDYPEYDGVEYLTGEKVFREVSNLLKKIKKIKEAGKKSKIYQEGIKITIIGKPNVGKSTLLNAFSKEEKAIVSPIAGTTRDVVETKCYIAGIPVLLLDTAGIHKTNNLVENIGIKKSYSAIKKADIILFLTDNSCRWEKDDEEIFKRIKKKKFILVINKSDKKKKFNIPDFIGKEKSIEIVAKNKKIEDLEKKISKVFLGDFFNDFSTYPYLSQSWQQAKINQLIKKLQEIITALKEKVYLDAVCGDLEITYKKLKELEGKNYNDDLLDIIFKRFCLGK